MIALPAVCLDRIGRKQSGEEALTIPGTTAVLSSLPILCHCMEWLLCFDWHNGKVWDDGSFYQLLGNFGELWLLALVRV